MRKLFCFFIILTLLGCAEKNEVDLILHNGKIFTVNEAFDVEEAMAVSGDSIVEVGPEHQILNKYHTTNTIDLAGKVVYPGFIDAHSHFIGYAKYSALLNLNGIDSKEAFFKKIDAFVKASESDWIVGRGWDQNRWKDKSFPDKSYLDENYPDRFFVLKRVDGHAALVSQNVLDLAGIGTESKIEGGEIELTEGNCTGILIDNAVDQVENLIPDPEKEELKSLILKAQQACFDLGLTTVTDAGLDLEDIQLLQEMKADGSLKIKIYAMLNPTEENFKKFLNSGPTEQNGLNIRSFKFYADGALGSRGACLLQPYADRPEHYGLILESQDSLRRMLKAVYKAGFQANTHAIGDSANRMMLDLYGEILQGTNDRRWRIEHAQVVHPDDLRKFREFSVIPSVQPTHATSDMPWAEQRLGENRIHHAYAYKSLKDQNGMIALGTDFPVEDIDPLWTYIAATKRVNQQFQPEEGFLPDEALSPEDCIRGMTIWAALANFEEFEKGSLEAGKKADFVILNIDLTQVTEKNTDIYNIVSTYLDGEKVH